MWPRSRTNSSVDPAGRSLQPDPWKERTSRWGWSSFNNVYWFKYKWIWNVEYIHLSIYRWIKYKHTYKKKYEGHWQAGLPVRAEPGGLQRPRGQHGLRWRADGPGGTDSSSQYKEATMNWKYRTMGKTWLSRLSTTRWSTRGSTRRLPTLTRWETTLSRSFSTYVHNVLTCTMCIYLSSRRPQAMDGTCKFNASNVGATIKSWTDVASGSEPDLQKVSFKQMLWRQLDVWTLINIDKLR